MKHEYGLAPLRVRGLDRVSLHADLTMLARLKNEYGLAPLRVRGLERVSLHADLVMLARLSQALARARAMPLAA